MNRQDQSPLWNNPSSNSNEQQEEYTLQREEEWMSTPGESISLSVSDHESEMLIGLLFGFFFGFIMLFFLRITKETIFSRKREQGSAPFFYD